MRCLITGVAGFIGSNLSERLLAAGHEVTGVDCLTDNYDPQVKRRNLLCSSGHRGFRLVEADLAEADLAPIVDGMDWVFHLAGQPGVRDSWGGQFTAYVHNNVLATQRLMEALSSVPDAHLVYASSSSVYGNAPLPMTENVRPEPISPYGVTKLTAENLVGAYSRVYGLPATSLRFFTVYGPRQRPDMAFNRFIRAIANDETIQLYGDGTQTRDFTFVDDIVDACIRAAATSSNGEILNVGGGSSVTINDILDYLGDRIGRPIRVEKQPGQRGDVAHTAASTARIRATLGWSPRTDWREGLRQQVEWQIGRTTSRRPTMTSLESATGGRRRLTSVAQLPATIDPPRGPSPRILIYGHDTYGLGHLRRNLTVATGLTRAYPEASILLLTGSPAVQSFAMPANVDYIKLPSVVKVADDDYRSLTLRVQPREIVRMRAALIREAMLGFAPDVVLVDHAPAGMKGELLPALEELRRTRPHARVALGLRDVVDEPERVRRQWQAGGMHAILDRLYDTILVYGIPEIMDIAGDYGVSVAVATKTRYCGYLRREITPGASVRLRAEYCPNGEQLVVVTAGGGGDGYPLLSAYVDGCAEAQPTNAVSLLIAGPFMAPSEHADLARRAARYERVRVLDFAPDMPALLQAADLAVSMGGYNTLCEVLSTGVPTIVVPRTEPRREQLVRASAFAKLGLVRLLTPDDLTPATLMSKVGEVLSDAPGNRASTARAIESLTRRGGLRGLDAAVEVMGDLIAQASQFESRRSVSA